MAKQEVAKVEEKKQTLKKEAPTIVSNAWAAFPLQEETASSCLMRSNRAENAEGSTVQVRVSFG